MVPSLYADGSAHKVAIPTQSKTIIVKEIWYEEDGLNRWEYYSNSE
jgi:hypothetical protein